jgi:hypothetical protein
MHEVIWVPYIYDECAYSGLPLWEHVAYVVTWDDVDAVYFLEPL